MKNISPSSAILLGSLIVSFSILLHGGIIQIKGLNTVGGRGGSLDAAAGTGAQPVAKTEADYIKALEAQASKLGLDTGKFNQCLESGSKAQQVAADLSEGSNLGIQGTPGFFVNGKPFLRGAVPYEEFKKVIDDELNGLVPASDKKTVGLGNLPVLGNQNAPVTLVEFSDYQCPFCGKFYNEAEAAIKKDYVATGKVRLAYRDFPLNSIHPGAQKGAEAARCAGDQNKYWEYHDMVFANQASIF